MVYRREATRPNEIWQADHTELDIWVLDDKGEPARPWLTAFADSSTSERTLALAGDPAHSGSSCNAATRGETGRDRCAPRARAGARR